jgi:hypothetical protein
VNGFITMAMYLPEEDVFVAVFTNCECNSPVDITAKLAALAIGKPYSYKPITIDSSILAQYTGVYDNNKGQQRVVTLEGNQLYARLNRAPKTPIKPYEKDRFFFVTDTMSSLAFKRNSKGEVEGLIAETRSAVEVWTRTNNPIPDENGITLEESILAGYAGVYQVNPEFSFSVTTEKGRIFVTPTGQEKFEIFAASETKFFLKINDAQMVFIRDSDGKITKVEINQGGRKTEAKKMNP